MKKKTRRENDDTGAADDVASLIEDYLDAFEKKQKKEGKSRGQAYTDLGAVQSNVRYISMAILDCLRDNNIAGARAQLRELIRQQTSKSAPWHICKSLTNVAGFLLENGMTDFTRVLLEYAKVLNGNDPVVDSLNAEVLKAEGDLAGAKQEYARIKAAHPGNVVAQNGYAEALKAEGDLAGAKQEYARIKAAHPNDVVAQNGYAEVLKAEGNLLGAKQEYARIKAAYPDNIIAQTGYAEVLKAEGDLMGAKQEYARIKAAHPNDVVAQNGYAEALKAEGDLAGAWQEYSKIVEKFPFNQVARHGFAYLSLIVNQPIGDVPPIPDSPRSENDYYWLQFHISRLMREANWTEALRLSELGLTTCNFYALKLLFKRLRKYIRLQIREYDAAIADLGADNEQSPVDYLLNTHLFAELNRKEEALAELKRAARYREMALIFEPLCLISEKYSINGLPKSNLPPDELTRQISLQEYRALILA